MENRKKLLLGISASPRARLSTDGYLEILSHISDYQNMNEVVRKLAGEHKISNTEGLLLAALFGARSEGVEIDAVNLRDVFQRGRVSKEEFADKLNRCSGIVAATPVYFGDRSSWFDYLVEHIKNYNVQTENKIFGAVSVGAKRNGGQETTLIFGLLDALNLGYNIVGNGPPTAQYGGTGWAGDIGKIHDDNFGLDTSVGLGSRIKRYLEILSCDEVPLDKLKIGVLYSGFRKGDREIEDVVASIKNKGAGVLTLDVDELKIRPCLGCATCPALEGLHYRCAIKDDMEKARDISLAVDGLVFMLCKGRKPNWQYYTFLERTRFIRHENFIMSDIPFGAYYVEDRFIGSQYLTRMFTSFLRHNMFIVSPMVQLINYGKQVVESNNPDELFSRVLTIAAKSKAARESGKVEYVYEAIGYGKLR